MDLLLFKTTQAVQQADAAGAPVDFFTAFQRVLGRQDGAGRDGGTPRDVTSDYVFYLIFLVTALVIAFRCRGGRIDSVLLAFLFPTIYTIVYAARIAVGDKSAACEASRPLPPLAGGAAAPTALPSPYFV